MPRGKHNSLKAEGTVTYLRWAELKGFCSVSSFAGFWRVPKSRPRKMRSLTSRTADQQGKTMREELPCLQAPPMGCCETGNAFGARPP